MLALLAGPICRIEDRDHAQLGLARKHFCVLICVCVCVFVFVFMCMCVIFVACVQGCTLSGC